MELWDRLTEILALLGGSAFIWKLVDLYRARVQVGLTSIDYDEHHAQGSVLTMELDNNGPHPLLLKREATLRGIHLGEIERGGRWIKPRVCLDLRLLGERRIDPINSRLLHWKLREDQLPPGQLRFVYWIRITLRLSNTRRRVTGYIPRLGLGTVGSLRYWYGYSMYRYFHRLTRALVKRRPT